MFQESDKHWFLLVVCIVLIWQCIVTDIYVFNIPPPSQRESNETLTNFSDVISTISHVSWPTSLPAPASFFAVNSSVDTKHYTTTALPTPAPL
jgi:hypothetical protein